MLKTGLIMPAYNARATVVDTIQRIPTGGLAADGYALSLYVVDDGSDDETAAVVREISVAGLEISVLGHQGNRGYGAAQKTGLAASMAAGNQAHVVLHSDGQYAPEELCRLLAPLQSNSADVVIGSKFMNGSVLRQGMPLPRMIGIRLMDTLENLVFGLKAMEFHSGYMAYSTEALALARLPDLTDGFHFDGEMVLAAAKQGLRVVRVPISTNYRKGTSSLNPWPYLAEVAGVVARYRRMGYWFQREG